MNTDWREDESAGFSVKAVTSSDGTIWLRLHCSVHGNLRTAGIPWDVRELNIAIEGHYQEKHVTQQAS